MTEEKVLDKIRKLLRLGESPNQNEATAAIAKAQELMEKYRISEALLGSLRDFVQEEKIESFAEPLFKGEKNRSNWHIQLAVVLAEANSCKVFLRGPDIFLVGRESDAATVRFLFMYCSMEIVRLGLKFHGQGKGKGWMNQYRLGAIKAIDDRFKEMKDRVRKETIQEHGAAGSAAIIKVDSRKEAVTLWMDQNMRLRASKPMKAKYNLEAQGYGYRDGKKIDLNQNSKLDPGRKKLPG